MVRSLESERGIPLALDAISKRAQPKSGQKTTVTVLARYNFLLDEESLPKAKFRAAFPKLDITWMTVHGAKGKEADYVVTLGLVKGKNGFPSEKVTDAFLEFLLPEQEAFRFAEERRLFYVAITRARHRVYLVYNPLLASTFIKELINNSYSVCTTEFDEALVHADVADMACPRCKTGDLVPRKGENSIFIGCNNYPYCRYTEQSCPQCSDLMQRDGRFKVCTNDACGGVVPICPKCNAEMTMRNGRYGEFWGCRNYHGDSGFTCKHTENQIIFPTKSTKP